MNYLPRFSPQLISLERYTLSVYRAGEIDLFENLDIVHIRLLVAAHTRVLVRFVLLVVSLHKLHTRAWMRVLFSVLPSLSLVDTCHACICVLSTDPPDKTRSTNFRSQIHLDRPPQKGWLSRRF